MEDGWRRRETRITHEQPLNILGYPFLVRSNDEGVPALARRSEQRFSACAPVLGALPATLDLFVLDDGPNEPLEVPQLENRFKTIASGARGLIQLGAWGSIFGDWEQRTGFGIISRALLAQPAIASRHAIDTFMLVQLLRNPIGMLHASGLVKAERVILLVGEHGTGKSTTALHLLRAGYRIISDSLIFARQTDEQAEVLGYAVGELKLTLEGRALFPELPAHTRDFSIDGRRKPIYDLRALMPTRVENAAVKPRRITLCLVSRSADARTHLAPLDRAQTLTQIIASTSYLDELPVMAQNVAVIDRLIQQAEPFTLALGRDPQEIVAALESMGQ